MIADLHCHSHYSDGDLPPEEVALHCKKSGSEVFALTDHDTMIGISEAEKAAKKLGLKFLPGVEISSFDKCNVHVLGYRVDPDHPKFKEFALLLAQARRDRMERTVELFKKNGMEITMDEVMSYARFNPSRAHIARAAVARGYAHSLKEVFDTFLREGGPCYLPNDALTPVDAVRLIVETGGVAVIAHPVRLKLNIEDRIKLIKKLKDEGLQGVEASYKNFDYDILKPYFDIAKELELFVTNGGDFHSPERSTFLPREISDETAAALGLL